VIKAQSYGQALPADRAIEHAAERDSVYRNSLDSKADDSTAKLIHDDQNPVLTKQDRIGREQVQTPQAILGVTEHEGPHRRQSGWECRARMRRTTSLLLARPKVLLRCWAILGQPKRGLRRLHSQMA